MRLSKHGHPYHVLRDVLELRRIIASESFDLVHCHMPADHLIAALALRRSPLAIIRSYYDAQPPEGWRARVALRRTGAILVATDAVARRFESAFPLLAPRLSIVEPPLDCARFATAGRDESLRRSWNASAADFVVGVVARMQTHRLFPELIEGFTRAAGSDPQLRLVVLGRGTHADEVARGPARVSAAADRIFFPGYVAPEVYPNYLPCFDALLFLVPGSDGTCRALREALASGVPALVSRRGLLPELITEGVDGWCLEGETPDAIAAGIRRARSNPSTWRQMAASARARAQARFDSSVAGRTVVDIYRRLLAHGPQAAATEGRGHFKS
jgi:glycosyltransferase involved in cell wall biosynthesis